MLLLNPHIETHFPKVSPSFALIEEESATKVKYRIIHTTKPQQIHNPSLNPLLQLYYHPSLPTLISTEA